MNQRREALVRLLADGREHSGEALARQLNISRAAVWKHVRTLAELGLAVHGTGPACLPTASRHSEPAGVYGYTSCFEQ